ncbi:MAG: tetratricopeptide repeat protein, partial [Paracoccaceae bacterium]
DNPDWEKVQRQIWAAWNRSGSDSMDLLAQRADRAMAAEDYEAARAFLNDLVRLAPDFTEGWNKRATLHFMNDDYGKSLDDIAEVLRREPRHFGALSGLGIILDRIGDQAGALEAYRRAVAIHPNLPGAQDGIKKLEKQVEGRRL